MTNLKTKYLGLTLKNPLVASASALSKKLSNIKAMEDAGISCVVLYSLFEEEINHESKELHHFLSRGTESFAEALTYFPEFDTYNTGADRYLELISEAKREVDIPIIGSLNGVSTSGWTQYAKNIEEAGADALELNIYFLPTDKELSSQEMEKKYIALAKTVKESISIPIAVKLSPFFTSLPNFINKIADADVDGLVLFNRFYQPDLNIEEMKVEPHLALSNSNDMLLPLRWTAILSDKITPDIALTSGVHSGRDMIKALMAGAAVTMTASELVENGIARSESMLVECSNWMDAHGYESIDNLRGTMSQKSVAYPAAFERANYMKALTIFDNEI